MTTLDYHSHALAGSGPRYNRPLHWLAVLTACATFPLIFMGGLVTSHGAGMSVPDWPNSFGYNMFLFPPNLWIGGIFYEHVHRLMGTVVGFLSLLLAGTAIYTERRGPRVWLSIAVLVGVIFQGVLGGLRVVLVELNLAVVHGCVAQAFFCLTVAAVIFTSRWWIETPRQADAGGRKLFRLAAVSLGVIYLQLVAGALMRHYQAGLAIPDLPLAYGKVLPPMNAASLAAVNQVRAYDLNLPPVSLGQVWLHFTHRLGALAVTAFVLWTCLTVFIKHRHRKGLYRPAVLLVVLLVTQITLGVLTVLDRKPADIASAHVAVGALVLATMFALTMRSGRLFARAAPIHSVAPAGPLPEASALLS
jgi:cytochrome c oxidase assembly protein subunit 15